MDRTSSESPTFYLADAYQVGPSTIRVAYTKVPLSVNSAGSDDALNPSNYEVDGELSVVSVSLVEDSSYQFDLSLSEEVKGAVVIYALGVTSVDGYVVSSDPVRIESSGLNPWLIPRMAVSPDTGVVGSVVRLDGSLSEDLSGGEFSCEWSFVSVPIGSAVHLEGFRDISGDGTMASFSPDIVGEYVVGLRIRSGTDVSDLHLRRVSIRALLVPHGRGMVPDGKFIWNYVRDVWSQVDGREWFETFWSALIQLVGSEMLNLYQTDFNKSIKDIQELYQRRWLSYEPRLKLDTNGVDLIFGGHRAGNDASTTVLGTAGKVILTGPGEVTVVEGGVLPRVAGEDLVILEGADAGTYVLSGVNASGTGYVLDDAYGLFESSGPVIQDVQFQFSQKSAEWEILSGSEDSVQVGDYVLIPHGPNRGKYRVLDRQGTTITVSSKPPADSNGVQSAIYRPVGFTLSYPVEALTDTFHIPYQGKDITSLLPGRLISVGGYSGIVSRVSNDFEQVPARTVISVKGAVIPSLQSGMNWRIPHTLVSGTQDFEALGVSSGDLLRLDVVGQGSSGEVLLQIVGVSENSVGVVLEDGLIPAGEVPPVPGKMFESLSSAFGVPYPSSEFQGIIDIVNSTLFQRAYGNRRVAIDEEIEVGDYSISLVPREIIRNRLIPVHEDLRSIPLLQEYIKQPRDVDPSNPPVLMVENSDFVIDDEVAFKGEMSIKTGTNILDSSLAYLVGRDIRPGDVFKIHSPSVLYGEYIITKVLDQDRASLSFSIPDMGGDATVTCSIVRRRKGRFIRIIPGGFSASYPAPNTLWAEVSFFDNSQAIEDNFGFLVGLKREDLDKISTDISYKQAVAGLMYAYTNGSMINKVRTGAHILLGLPFAEHRGIVRSIEDDYRLDLAGNPVEGRILIEDTDQYGSPTGRMRVYTFPLDPQSASFSGIDTNPSTGAPYAVGDEVGLFSPLCKGVEISDYVSSSLGNDGDVQRLQRFHAYRVRANDAFISEAEMGLLSSFLKRITPAHVAYVIPLVGENWDQELVSDGMAVTKSVRAYDGALSSLPMPLMFDYYDPMGVQTMEWDAMYWPRRFGRDLEAVAGTSRLRVPSGGLITPRIGEEFVSPLIKQGDSIQIFDGPYSGTYEVASVLSDTEFSVVDAPSVGFSEFSGSRFLLSRKIDYRVGEGLVDIVSGNSSVPVGITAAEGAAIGDMLIVSTGNRLLRYTVTEVNVSSVTVYPVPTESLTEASFSLVRPGLVPSTTESEFEVSSDGSGLLTAANPSLGIINVRDEIEVSEVLSGGGGGGSAVQYQADLGAEHVNEVEWPNLIDDPGYLSVGMDTYLSTRQYDVQTGDYIPIFEPLGGASLIGKKIRILETWDGLFPSGHPYYNATYGEPTFTPCDVLCTITDYWNSNGWDTVDIHVDAVAIPNNSDKITKFEIISDSPADPESLPRVIVLDRVNLFTQPPLPVGVYRVRVQRKTPLNWEQGYIVSDSVGAVLQGPSGDASTEVGSTVIHLNSDLPFVLPGDLIQLTSGSNSSVDVGYGGGYFPIVKVESPVGGGTDLYTSIPLQSTESSGWKIIRRA